MLLIKTNRDTLLKPLQTVTGIVERRQTLPILSNVLIRQNQEKTSFLTTDLEIQIKTEVAESLSSQKDFAFTVSAKKLQDILRSLSADIEVTLTRKDDHLLVKSHKRHLICKFFRRKIFPKSLKNRNPIMLLHLRKKNSRIFCILFNLR